MKKVQKRKRKDNNTEKKRDNKNIQIISKKKIY